MFRKTLLVTALCASTISLSGCSTMWRMASDFSADMAEVTKFSFLRGSSSKNDISFAENNVDPETGVFKTDVGEYTPAEPVAETYIETASYTETTSFTDTGVIDTSPHPCPDGTYLTEDETCMSLEVDTYDFGELDAANASQFVDTSQHECPEDTYLNAENTCMYFETETFDFGDIEPTGNQTVDTSPHPCPEETYLTADGTCQFLNNEPTDFALNTDISDVTTAASVLPAVSIASPVSAAPSNAFAANLSVECPEGFKANADNSCMYLGAELQK